MVSTERGGQRSLTLSGSDRFLRSHRFDPVFISNLSMSSFTHCSRIPAGFGPAKPAQLFPLHKNLSSNMYLVKYTGTLHSHSSQSPRNQTWQPAGMKVIFEGNFEAR